MLFHNCNIGIIGTTVSKAWIRTGYFCCVATAFFLHCIFPKFFFAFFSSQQESDALLKVHHAKVDISSISATCN